MMNLYGTYAADIAALVHNDVLLADDRMAFARQASVSPSTVFRAYLLLEGEGLTGAPERSGYYVAVSDRRR